MRRALIVSAIATACAVVWCLPGILTEHADEWGATAWAFLSVFRIWILMPVLIIATGVVGLAIRSLWKPCRKEA